MEPIESNENPSKPSRAQWNRGESSQTRQHLHHPQEAKSTAGRGRGRRRQAHVEGDAPRRHPLAVDVVDVVDVVFVPAVALRIALDSRDGLQRETLCPFAEYRVPLFFLVTRSSLRKMGGKKCLIMF